MRGPGLARYALLSAVFAAIACASTTSGPPPDAVVPLVNAHAHNDYRHPRPLLDALDHGFCSIEADIFLVEGRLLVAHDLEDTRPDRTLEGLYLDPLRARARAHGGRIYPGGPPVLLFIDFKSEADSTYAVLRETLERYADMLTEFRGDTVEERAVTVVISGNRPIAAFTGGPRRLVAIDGRAADLDSDVSAALKPVISEHWGSHFRWTGLGPMPDDERERLREFVRKAHARGRKVRFWATRERPALWDELLAAGVDLINTDDLAGLRDYLLARRTQSSR